MRLVSEVASHDEDKIVAAMRLVSNMRPFETEIGFKKSNLRKDERRMLFGHDISAWLRYI